MNTQYCSLPEACQRLHVCSKTLRRYLDRLNLEVELDPLDHRRGRLRIADVERVDTFLRLRRPAARRGARRGATKRSVPERNDPVNAIAGTDFLPHLVELEETIHALEAEYLKQGEYIGVMSSAIEIMMRSLTSAEMLGEVNRKWFEDKHQAWRERGAMGLVDPASYDNARAHGKPARGGREHGKSVIRVNNIRELSPDVVPWRDFARLHGMSLATVQKAISDERLRVISVKVGRNRRASFGVLDPQAQMWFHMLFANLPRFVQCPQCPHKLDIRV